MESRMREAVDVIAVPAPDADPWFVMKDTARKEIAKLRKQIAHFEEMLVRLDQAQKAAMGESFTNVRPVLSNEYRGLAVTKALEVYMRARPGVNLRLTDIVKDLIAGGVQAGKPRRGRSEPADLIAQNIKIALPKLRRLFAVKPEGKLRGIPDHEVFLSLAATGTEVRPRNLAPKTAKPWSIAEEPHLVKRRNQKRTTEEHATQK